MAYNWTCTISVAIITVLIWMLMCKLFCNGNKPEESADFFKTSEAFIFYSAFIAYYLNQMIYPDCRVSSK